MSLFILNILQYSASVGTVNSLIHGRKQYKKRQIKLKYNFRLVYLLFHHFTLLYIENRITLCANKSVIEPKSDDRNFTVTENIVKFIMYQENSVNR